MPSRAFGRDCGTRPFRNRAFRGCLNVYMKLNPALFQPAPTTHEVGTMRAMPFSNDHHFDHVDSKASTSYILADTILTDIDAALTLFKGILKTRRDFMITATLWALESIHTDPKVALRRLAATGAVTKVASMDDQHGSADGENTVA